MMAKKEESRLQLRVRKQLETDVGGWWFKVHGGPFQVAGLPDLIGCVDGMFFGFEVKTATGSTSKLQDYTLEQMRERGGAHVYVVTSPEEAVRYVRRALEKTGRLPAKNRRV